MTSRVMGNATVTVEPGSARSGTGATTMPDHQPSQSKASTMSWSWNPGAGGDDDDPGAEGGGGGRGRTWEAATGSGPSSETR